MIKACIIVPVYNHEAAIPEVIAQLKGLGIPTFLVNDGSSVLCSQILAECAEREVGWLVLINRFENGGKGAAVLDGFKHAIGLGFSHAVQIDADGQHEMDDIPRFLEACRQHPAALILGRPVFDASAPKIRVYGRFFSNLWVWINTLSFAVDDSLCGFRVYPLAAVAELIRTTNIGRRMDFDVDILVRLYWQGLEVINIPTRVRYPFDGVSHFKMFRDNLMIIKAQARLFFGMLTRIPQLLGRHFP